MKQFNFKVSIEFDDELSKKFQDDEIENINEEMIDDIQSYVESIVVNEIVGIRNSKHITVNVNVL